MGTHRHLRLFAFLLAFVPVALCGQHTRQGLTSPDYDNYNLRGWPRQMIVVQHYGNGSQSSSPSRTPNDVNFQETYTFDSTGHLVEYRKRGFGGEQITTYPLSLVDSDGGWNHLGQRLYRFDYDGDVLEIRQLDLRGRLYTSTHCIYAEGGNLVQSIEYTYSSDSSVVIRRTVFNYDKHERLSSAEQYSVDELLLWKEKRTYDRRGNLSKRVQTFYNDDETTVSTELRSYTFDNKGNWIECRLTIGGQFVCTIDRSIEYYDE